MSEDSSKIPTQEKKGKMATASADEQLKFLLSCIRHTVNGKIDFAEVASECSIVSKGAAAKRYERLMKAHGIQQQAAISPRDASVASAKLKKAANGGAAAAAAAATKKRKAFEAESTPNYEEDDEVFPRLAENRENRLAKKRQKVKKEEPKTEIKEEEGIPRILQFDGASHMPVVKAEPAIKAEQGVVVKEEPTAENTNVLTVEDEKMFDQFLQPGDFDQSIVIAD
ncbi:MAG: hypothetical protein Q9225_005879 [Loekoesia sp. 1 TL-2023]